MSSFFKNLKDEDFYSTEKLTHIYLNGEIDATKINKLFDDVNKANNLKEKKPILIHISSIGGFVQDGIRLRTVFKISKLPIATIIDNYCFSIATLLLIDSPYRIVTKNSFCLLHEYKITGYINDTRHEIVNYITKLDAFFKTIIEMYLKKTNLKKKELEELLGHNLLIDGKNCIKKGIADRLIHPSYNHKNQKLTIYKIIKGVNITTITISCDMTTEAIDKLIMNIDKKQPCVIYSNFTNCGKVKKGYNTISQFTTILTTLNLATKINAIPVYKTGIIDVPINLENLLPLLMTDRIYMYEHCYIIVNYPLLKLMSDQILMEDNIKNITLITSKIKEILEEKTKMNKKQIQEIDKKFMVINSTQAKSLGLCHEIIKS
jgi:ATP-dependent protease ClpP protease subunit